MNEQLANHQINQAVQWLQSGQPAKARDSLQRVLKAFPNSPELHFLLGLAALPLAQDEVALRHFNQAIALEPRLLEAYVNRGILLKNKGQLQAALRDFDHVIRVNPSMVQAYTNRGNVKVLLKQLTLACEDFAMAIRLDPQCVDALLNMGSILVREGAYREGLPLLERVIAVQPDMQEALLGMGTALSGLGRHKEALERFTAVLRIRPEHADARCGLANALAGCGEFQQARLHFDQLLQSCPKSVFALNGKAALLMETGERLEARQLLEQAMLLDPEFHLARFNLSLLQLQQGDLLAGWQGFESRKLDLLLRRRCGIRQLEGREWQGEDLAGKTLLLHQEQGLGDSLQMLRYVPLLQARGARLLLLLDRPLVALAQAAYPQVAVYEERASVPAYDLHCPMMSLPLHFATGLDGIPSPQAYLQADAVRCQQWAERLGKAGQPRIGLVWSGSRQHQNDRQRSVPLALLAPLLSMKADFHSLQKEYREDADTLSACGIRDHAAQLHDMAETAALIMQLDLVISVDTSVAHLAAALGKPCWIMLAANPDFRWGLTGKDSPWYAAVRLFRQDGLRDWSVVLADVCTQLGQQLEVVPAE